jgi:hypothetical protein
MIESSLCLRCGRDCSDLYIRRLTKMFELGYVVCPREAFVSLRSKSHRFSLRACCLNGRSGIDIAIRYKLKALHVVQPSQLPW